MTADRQAPYVLAPELGLGVEWLTRDDNGLAALAKPAGILSHPNTRGEESKALLNASYDLKNEVYLVDGKPAVWLLNRLDSGTSGVVLVAFNAALAASIRELFRSKHIRKTYQALVFGNPSEAKQTWRDLLAVEKQRGHVRTRSGGNIPAECFMTVKAQNRRLARPLALLQLEPRTGRSHQLRVQCANRHLPIVGDATYGDFAANRQFAKSQGEKRLFLHSLSTRFDYDWKGKSHSFTATAPLPEAFLDALKEGAR